MKNLFIAVTLFLTSAAVAATPDSKAATAPVAAKADVKPMDGGVPPTTVAPKLPDGGMAATPAAAPTPPPPPPKVFNRATVAEEMKSHVEEVQQCYEASLATKYGKDAEGMNGEVVASFTVNKKGEVRNAGVWSKKKGTVKDPDFKKCVVNVLNSMSFPAPKDGKNHPIEFPLKLKVTK